MKRQANALTAVLENWEDVENAIDIYANSAGSALRENEIYLDSWEAKSKAVSAAWNEFVNTFLNSDWIKGFLDGSQEIISFLTEINGAIPIFAGLLAGVLFSSILVVDKGVKKLTISFSALNLVSGGLPVLIGLTTTLITGLAAWGISASDTAKQIENLTTKIEEQQKAIDDLNAKEKEATDLYKEYASLMSKSNAYGLTAEEKENLLNISRDLVDTYGLEVQGIDAVTGAYILGTDAINDYIEALRAERLEKQKEQQKTRDKRIKKNLKTASDYISPSDIDDYLANAKKYYGLVKDKGDSPEELTTDEINFMRDFQARTISDGINEEMQEYVSNNNISAFETSLYQSAGKYTSAINSVIKDVIDNIKVDSADYVNQNGENVLTSIMQSILPNIDDLDKKRVDEIQSQVETFVGSYGYALDEIGSKNKQIQERLNSDTVGISDYKDLLENQLQQLSVIYETFGKNSEEAKIFAKQLDDNAKNNAGLIFADISKTMGESELDTTNFDKLATSILQLDRAMTNGESSFSEYIDGLNKNIDDISLKETFQDDEKSATEFFHTLTTKGQSAIQNLAAQMQNGEISQEDYLGGINDIIDYFDNLSEKSISIFGDDNKTSKEITNVVKELSTAKTELEGLMGVIKAIPDTFEEYQNGGVNAVNSLTSALQNAGIEALKVGEETINGAENIAKAMQNNSQAFAAGQVEIAQKTRNNLVKIGSGVGTLINGMIKLFDKVKISILPPKVSIFEWIKGIVTGKTKNLDFKIKVGGSVDTNSFGNLFADALGDIDWGFNDFKGGGSTGGSTVTKKDNSKDTKETFDCIETKISRLQRTITNLGKTVSATWKSWTERNSALKSQISAVTSEINLQANAANKYLSLANSVGLGEGYKSLVRNGSLNISTIKDENTINAIKKYKEYYENYLSALDAKQDAEDELASLVREDFDLIAKQFDSEISLVEANISTLEAYIDQTEMKGNLVSKNYYSAMYAEEQKNLGYLQQKYDKLSNALSNGTIKQGSEEWNSMSVEIKEVSKAIIESNTALEEYQKTMRELDWEVFDLTQSKIENMTEESEFLIDLLSKSKLFNEDGSITSQGQATLGLHVANMKIYESQISDYAQAIKELDNEFANDPLDQDYLARRQELVELQRDSILNYENEKSAIKDLYSDGMDNLLSYMDKLIAKRKSLLSQASDSRSFQKTVQEQTDEIDRLQAIIGSYGENLSEEDRAIVQKHQVSLEKAESDLEDTLLDKQLEEEQKMLDMLADESKQFVSEILDNTNGLIQKVVESTDKNAETIKTTLETEVRSVGGTLTTEMQNLWFGSDGIKGVVGGVNDTLLGIKTLVQSMVDKSNAEANKNSSNVTSTVNPTSTPTSTPKPTTTTQQSSAKAITVGGMINASGALIYDYAGDTSGERQYYRNSPYYRVLGEKNGYLKVRHQSLSSGTTGWFKKSDVKAYKTGGLVDETGLAWLDGTKGKPELVLKPNDTENYLKLTDALRTVANTNMFDAIQNYAKLPNFVPNATNNNQQAMIIQGDIVLEGVQSPEDLARKMKEIYQGDVSHVRKTIRADVYGGMLGKNSLTRYKY